MSGDTTAVTAAGGVWFGVLLPSDHLDFIIRGYLLFDWNEKFSAFGVGLSIIWVLSRQLAERCLRRGGRIIAFDEKHTDFSLRR
jgi:hypothetical protein